MHVAVRQNQCAGVALRMCDMSVRFLKLAGAAALAAVLLFSRSGLRASHAGRST